MDAYFPQGCMKTFKSIQHQALDAAANGTRVEEFQRVFGDEMIEGLDSKGYIQFVKYADGVVIVVPTLAGTRCLLDIEGLIYD